MVRVDLPAAEENARASRHVPVGRLLETFFAHTMQPQRRLPVTSLENGLFTSAPGRERSVQIGRIVVDDLLASDISRPDFPTVLFHQSGIQHTHSDA